MFSRLIHYRHILLNLIFWELKRRYTTPRLGLLWPFIQYTIILGVYTFIFSWVLGVKLPGYEQPLAFAFYVFTGLLPWLTFQEALIRSTRSLEEHAGIIKNIIFPVEFIPVYQICVGLLHMLIGIGLLILLLWVFNFHLGPGLFLLPLPILLQLLISVGCGWMLSALYLKLKDIAYIIDPLLFIWFWITPIVYTLDVVDNVWAKRLLLINPLTYLMACYQSLVLKNTLPGGSDLLIVAAFAGAIFIVGGLVFRRVRPWIADWV